MLELGARLGLRPWEVRRMSVSELQDFQRAQEWRRRRDMGAFAVAMTFLLNRIPVFSEDPHFFEVDELERMIAGHMPSEEE